MTAEIAVINKSCIALAADSAVTIEYSTNGLGKKTQKIYNSVNKLFTLSKHHPVGVMIFGSADLMGVPWEVIIKLYRHEIKAQCFDTIEEYKSDFLRFLETKPILFSTKVQDDYVHQRILSVFSAIAKQINDQVEHIIENKGKISNRAVTNVVNQAISEFVDMWRTKLDFPCCSSTFAAEVVARYSEFIGKATVEIFRKLPLNANAASLLEELVGLLFVKDFANRDSSGVVIAGYGEAQIFPSLRAVDITAVVNGKLLHKPGSETDIDDDNRGAIIPFAQRDMVFTFMEGVDPAYDALIDGYVSTIIDAYPEAILSSLPRMAKAKKTEIINNLKQMGENLVKEFEQETRKYRLQTHVHPITRNISSLPKDELASLAEALVNLTSLKRRVSLAAETVGGPIDVAIISKGDGFVWIKRKHYFKPELNHGFFASYYRKSPDVKENNDGNDGND